jgi:signal transduction histidine kinase/FixJ family two-component response regulator
MKQKSISTDTVSGNEIRILVVEDNRALNFVAAEVLRREGFDVLQTFSGAEALAIASREKNLLFLIDYNLPDMTGKEVAEALLSVSNRSSFLVMTGHGDEKTAVEMMRLGARDYVVKEADFISLLPHVVRRTIDQIEKERRLKRTERLLKLRERALRSVYQMATSSERSFSEMCDRAVDSLTNILHVGCALAQVEAAGGLYISQRIRGHTGHPEKMAVVEPCKSIYDSAAPRQYQGNLKTQFPDCRICAMADFHSFVGVPVAISGARIQGALCLFDYKARVFTEDEIHLIEIFAQYLSHEIERDAMERQIRHGQEMKLLGQLTSGVAHEVRNPLNAIGGMIEALFAELEGQAGLEEYKMHIHAQVDRLSHLMHDLLALGRPAGDFNQSLISLRTFLAKVVEMWNRTGACNGQIAMFESNERDTVDVQADDSKLRQAVLNLLDNAGQHSPSGSMVRVHLFRSRAAAAVIRIVDAGKGIAEDHLARIFEPFYTTRREGTGLGLSIVRRVVEMHKGRIAIWNNDPPPGVTVEITLPAAPRAG